MKLRNKNISTITLGSLAIIGMLGILTTHCKKIEPERLIIIKTGAIKDVTQTSCVANATLFDVGVNSRVSQHGFCYSLTDKLIDIIDCTQLGPKNEKGEFEGMVEGLTPGTRYYLWAYASEGNDIFHGKSVSFDTPPLEKPALETAVPFDVSSNSAHSGGVILSNGGAGIEVRGVCWNTSPAPTTAHFKTENGTGTGEFGSDLTGLEPDTKYYIRAYATNSAGTGYGNEHSFTTTSLSEPVIAELTTQTVVNINVNSASSGGDITSDGGSEITARGVCWNTSPTPTTDHFKTSNGVGSGKFESDLAGLEPETKYYIRAYATNSAGTGYGNELNFTTPLEPKPAQLTTNPIEEITWNSAIGGGTIISEGGSEITERGLCWSLNSNPTKSDNYATSGGASGLYSIQIQELSPETEYFIRAYAINSVDIAYGNELIFSTLPEPIEPEVFTGDVEGIESTAALFNGSAIISDGGAPIISKGLCWSLNPNPSLADAFLEFGNGPDPFTMEIAELNQNTIYYVRAYATNSHNKTGYGNQQVFQTLFLCGSILQDPRDLKEYATVPIGDQCWMGQNLNVGQKIDTFSIQGNNGTLEKYCYGNDINNCDVYGGLYSWDEMMQYTTLEMTQGVCPVGWHIPSDGEWKTLETWLGMQPGSLDSTGYRGYNNEAGLLKSTATPPWIEPNLGAIDAYGFSALPSGMVWSDGSSAGLGYFTVFWTSTFIDAQYAVYRLLSNDDNRIDREEGGFRLNTTPVRCVKD